jgi:HK97 gp10 family phage protein
MAGQTIVNFELVGFDELRDELNKLSRHFQRKGADAMANAGAAIVLKSARRRAAQNVSKYRKYFSYIEEGKGEYAGMTIGGRAKWGGIRAEFPAGHVARNIFMGRSISKKLNRYGAYWRVFVAPQAWFARFEEYGFTGRDGRKFPAHAFIRPALKENVWKVIEAMKESLFWYLTKMNLRKIKVVKT